MSAEEIDSGDIEIFGASQNNLQSIDLSIPIGAFTVVTGVSGSGKSSLAFDTLYAEGQRRYVESMSAYARQFLERIQKPAVREIRGISPAIAIKQKSTTRNPRSTVGTVTEIYDFLRLFYARVGTVVCRECEAEVNRDSVDQVVEELTTRFEGRRAFLTFPLKGSILDLTADSKSSDIPIDQMIENLLQQGFFRLLDKPVDKARIRQLPQDRPESTRELLGLQILVDRLVISSATRERLTDSLEMSFAEGNGIAEVTLLGEDRDTPPKLARYSERFECRKCLIRYRPPEPRLFSFNNPYGACPTCHGFGSTINLDKELIIPDPIKTLREGPIDPFTKPKYRRFQNKLLEFAESQDIPLDVPYEDLPERFRRAVWQGKGRYPGVKGFFAYLNKKKYKMHVRIFISRYRGYSICSDCDGERLREEARNVHVGGLRIGQITQMSIREAFDFFSTLRLDPARQEMAGRLLQELKDRFGFLVQVGLEYLTLERVTSTLSGGEMQRIHLAASLGSSLAGALYVLDEPSIGLHPRDQRRLISILKNLRDLGNTMVVVEHEKEIITSADMVVDMGPGAGESGGHVVHSGPYQSMLENQDSLTGKYLRGDLKIATPVFRRSLRKDRLKISGARQHNLKNLDLEIPLGILVCITGVSGSGKSTLVHDILYAGIRKLRRDWTGPVGEFESIEGWERLTDILLVDQSPIGRTPRSNPVTYIKAFDEIRKTFASLRASRALNLTPAHFSFNVSGGRCESCQGSGTVTVEMQFLADVELTCEECKGTRYQERVLDVTYKGKTIHDVLNLTVSEAIDYFSAHTPLLRKLHVLRDVGLGYLRLGQSATTLSGGEAQRIKLAAFLAKSTSKNPLFVFDEPTTGLHFDDIGKLLRAFDKLISRGASVVVIEHNLDVIKSADWIIDLGPEGGDEGGRVVAAGTPEEIAECRDSHTGNFLKAELEIMEREA